PGLRPVRPRCGLRLDEWNEKEELYRATVTNDRKIRRTNFLLDLCEHASGSPYNSISCSNADDPPTRHRLHDLDSREPDDSSIRFKIRNARSHDARLACFGWRICSPPYV